MFVDAEGIWCTADPGTGDPLPKAIPTRTGWRAASAWPLPVDPHLAHRVAILFETHETTPRGDALVGIIETALDIIAAAALVPNHTSRGWRWQPAPDPALAERIDNARMVAGSAGLFLSGALISSMADDLLVDLVNALAPAPAPDPAVKLAPWRRWAELVTARRGANARLAIRLDPPAPDTDADWLLVPLLIALDDPTTRWPAADASSAPDFAELPPEARARWRDAELSAIRAAWPKGPLRDLRPYHPTDAELIEFLDTRAEALQLIGIDILAPGGLLRPAQVRRRVSASGGTGLLTAGALALSAQVRVDGELLTEAEVATLADSKTELVAVRGRWLRLSDADRHRLTRMLQALESDTTVAEALANDAYEGAEWNVTGLADLRPARSVEPPPDVNVTLRHYQRAGLDWLTWIEENGTGGVLADDMGLGKTLQVLTRIAADHPGPTLVVCPVTLVDTWVRQAAQFTPRLRVVAHHGTTRAEAEVARDADIVITTYGLLARDSAIRDADWHRVVLDEAQAIKNPDTRAAKAARGLTTTHRLAVTGTPVENHVLDLWSLMAFTNPGLLPRRAAFKRRFAGADPASDELQVLRGITSPFVLRRLKSDPWIAPDLPDRTIVRDDCALTKEQVGAYEAAVRVMLESLAEPGLKRRASVLGSISRLKQICVHPALLTESRSGLAGRSGKIDRLTELCAEIVDEGQAVVVFTQFASFAGDLARHLAGHIGVEALTLTGAHSRARRAATVERFNTPDGPPILVASIKAGGTGLTLVRANHVVHVDRWWNPAVEDQASDRVWRIGQKQKVIVHTLVCPGTLEDKIDAMLTAKRAVAESVVSTTDKAVTELSDAELTSLVELSRDRLLT